MRSTIYNLVKNIKTMDSREQKEKSSALSWILSGAELFRQDKPDVPKKHLSSYALLVHNKKKSC